MKKHVPAWVGAAALLWLFGSAAVHSAPAPAGPASPPANPSATPPVPAAAADYFETRVRPLLAARCYSCHSDQAQLSGLRLDSRQAALVGGKRGPALVAGDPEHSRLVTAVRYAGALKMPPAGRLPEGEVSILAAWVKMGAPWPSMMPIAGKGPAGTQLWALQPVRRPAVPRVRMAQWPKTPIDHFVLASLERRGLKPSPYADRSTLIRRVSLDLTGLPPTLDELDRFLQDRSADAWNRVVDRLLTSPHYGERMAQYWLDLARYADSDGYHDDTDRSMWAFRDYVIQSFNHNKPFDQFTIEQIAGDLLPNATLEQKIASAFNRCGPTSSEGGAIPEEYLARYAVDRVDTTGDVWLGLTVQCCECHDHKFDPLTTKDFYRLFAYFNQVPEDALYRGADAPPYLDTPTPQQKAKLDDMERQIAGMVAEEAAWKSGAAKPGPGDVAAVTKKLDDSRKARDAYRKGLPKLRLMQDVSPRRPTWVLIRGDYRNHGDAVEPGIPAILGSLPKDAPPNRLALAKWLVDPTNPLPARVTVNHLWQLVFGVGLVKSSDDFGVRGDKPSNPELLDWLADEFVHSGWDVRHILRLIVTSAVYQQSSRTTPRLQSLDPGNQFLARGPRFRLAAEFIRDNALAISGLLDRDRAPGGPSVKPYQPGDLWRELSSGDQEAKSYVQDHGPDLYRRGLYTFWKRSILYPAFSVFDAPNREVAVIRRPITNTPLQAFTTLNDVAYVEAARVFAQRVMREGGSTFDTRLTYALRLALARNPQPQERIVLGRLYQDLLAVYRQDPKAALQLASVGEAPRPADLDPAEHAAWTCVCNAILNLDETITKE